jgi:hypothetical protein
MTSPSRDPEYDEPVTLHGPDAAEVLKALLKVHPDTEPVDPDEQPQDPET